MEKWSQRQCRVNTAACDDDRRATVQRLCDARCSDVRVDAEELARSTCALDTVSGRISKRRKWCNRAVPVSQGRVRRLDVVAKDGCDEDLVAKALLGRERLDGKLETDWVESSGVADELDVVLDELGELFGTSAPRVLSQLRSHAPGPPERAE